jgi:membrane fusion protein (multidrug efflux system)
MDAEPKAATPPTSPPPEQGNGPSKRPIFRRGIVIVIGTVLLAILFFFGLSYLVRTFTHEGTDDAFLDGSIVAVAPKVAGQVKKVHVSNNQPVKAGELLLEIDPRDLEVALEQKRAAHESAGSNEQFAKASLALLRSQIETAEATARQSLSESNAVQASAEKTGADLKRAQDLLKQNAISPQEFDSTKAAATAAEANFRAAGEKASSDQSKVAQARAQLEAGIRAYERAQAQSHQAALDTQAAELNLSYARVTAPEDGFVTRKSVEPGDYLQTGQRVMALVTAHLWVTANFKETQLRKIRTNQTAEIVIDSVGGRVFPAFVESIQAGSGARFSLLPPENAVGNYIKVVQRVPVRLFFKDAIAAEHVLGPGMSVSPSVRVSDFRVAEPMLLLVAVVVALVIGLLWWALSRRSTESPT